jgi:thymidine kinase
MKHHIGSVEVITGSMFCGKTDELIRRLRRASIARQKVKVFKPVIDNRYAHEKVTSHAGSEFAAIPIGSAQKILEYLDKDTTVIAIDEAQFFEQDLIPIIQNLADRGLRVIVARVDTDFA